MTLGKEQKTYMQF